MRATELLRNDHQSVRNLFDQLDDVVGEDDRREVYDELKRSLEGHMKAEEDVFYVALREADQGLKPLVDESIGQHQDIRDLLETLDGLDMNDEEWDDRVSELKVNVLGHVGLEENRTFIEAERVCDPADLERMADEMLAIEEEARREARATIPDVEAETGIGL